MIYNQLRGECVCTEGYGLRSGICVDCGPCSQINAFTYQCECAATYFLIGGICGTCPLGSIYNAQSQSCKINCPSYSSYNQLTNKCVCQTGYYMDWISNQCLVRCPSGQSLQNGVCQCYSPLVMYNGQCVQKLQCPANSYFHLETYCCLCNANYRLVNQAC